MDFFSYEGAKDYKLKTKIDVVIKYPRFINIVLVQNEGFQIRNSLLRQYEESTRKIIGLIDKRIDEF